MPPRNDGNYGGLFGGLVPVAAGSWSGRKLFRDQCLGVRDQLSGISG